MTKFINRENVFPYFAYGFIVICILVYLLVGLSGCAATIPTSPNTTQTGNQDNGKNILFFPVTSGYNVPYKIATDLQLWIDKNPNKRIVSISYQYNAGLWVIYEDRSTK